MIFTRDIKVRFKLCDPAGIMFYPQYLVLLNDIVEDWFEEEIGVSFLAMHLDFRLGVPTVHVECDFLKPSRLGEWLVFEMRVLEIGRSAIKLGFVAKSGEEERFKAQVVLVCVTMREQFKSEEIPAKWRSKMEPYLA